MDGALEAAKELAAWRAQYGDPQGNIVLYRASGCEQCAKTGYEGRVGLHELLRADDAVKHLIQIRASVTQVKAAAVAAGMRTLKQNGIEKILQGLTDMPQVRAVCG